MFIKNTLIMLNGNVTGRVYLFRNINDTRWMGKPDAMSRRKVNEMNNRTDEPQHKAGQAGNRRMMK